MRVGGKGRMLLLLFWMPGAGCAATLGSSHCVAVAQLCQLVLAGLNVVRVTGGQTPQSLLELGVLGRQLDVCRVGCNRGALLCRSVSVCPLEL